jgi:2-polyprenyl-3-methyl-5-hydroxy-6-metoxy-1,4-benzoquinol methylase
MTDYLIAKKLPDTETSYGILKRFHYIDDVIASSNPKTVLDIGCGTGAHLTHPLAECHSQINFVGIDSDVASIDYANETHKLPNLEFSIDLADYQGRSFELIIASEVLEHVENPVALLGQIKSSLAEGGKVILTVPNGYGPSETSALLDTVMRLTGLFKFARALYRLARNKRPLFPASVSASSETLAISPHINFFSHSSLIRLLLDNGFKITSVRSRTIFCGLFFDKIIHGFKLYDWNAEIADKLNPLFASDWMFVLELTGKQSGLTYQRNLDARVRRYLNEKRFGLR